MTERSPDIEIYLKRVPEEAVLEWLSLNFEVNGTREKGATLHVDLVYGSEPVQCAIVREAARGGYCSVWFKENRTPWVNDEDCAKAAFSHFGTEIRCSKGGWEPGQADDSAWLRITDKGVSEVNWRT